MENPNIMEELYNQGDHFYDDLISACKKAQEEILIETYTFETDELGQQLLQVLEKKSLEGVKVKILIDGIGSFHFDRKLFKKLNSLHIRFFNPLPFQRPENQSLTISQFISSFFTGLFCINNRNHRKLYLIDKEVAFIGSINITSYHSFRLKGERSWRDCGIKFSHEDIKLLRESFFRIWEAYRSPKHRFLSKSWYRKIRKSSLRMNDCIKTRDRFQNDLVEKIMKAKRRVWITNPYFVPPPHFSYALEKAASRGIDVKVLIPRKSDMKLFPLINSLAGRKLIEKKVKIYEYLPRILHSKSIIIDDWCCLGSTNLNSRSFKHDLELDRVLNNPQNVALQSHFFLDDLTQSIQLKKHDIISQYGQQYLKCTFLRLIRYWL
jgi:cardiolipin synthase A/B